MYQEHNNLQSTKVTNISSPSPLSPDNDPVVRKNLFMCAVVNATDKIYSDLIGKFPVQFTLGNKYILVVYNYDFNAILAEPLRDKSSAEISWAHQVIYTYLTNRGLKPSLEVLDNKCSTELIWVMQKNTIEFQLVPLICTEPTL